MSPTRNMRAKSTKTSLQHSEKMSSRLDWKTEKILRDTVDKLQSTLDAIPDMVFEVGLDGCYYACHSPFSDLFYAPVTDVIGKKLSELVPSNVSEIVISAIREALLQGVSFGKCYELQVPRGKCWFEISVCRKDYLSGEPRFIVLMRDITSRKQNEEALRRNVDIQTVLKEIAEAAIQGIDIDELYRQVYQLIKRILPAKNFYIALLDEAAGKIVRQFCVDEMFFTPRERSVGKGLTEYVMRKGQVLHADQAELTRLRESGEVSPLEAPEHEYLGAPLKDSTGRSFGVIAASSADPYQPEDAEVLAIIAAQVSMAIKRKQFEAELRYGNEKLEQRVSERTNELVNAYNSLAVRNLKLEQTQSALCRSAEIQTVLRKIAEATILLPTLNELYETVHHLVQKVLPAREFYISLHDKEHQQIVFPYCVDATGSINPQRPVGRGLTEYLMRMGRGLHLTPEDLIRLVATGEISSEMAFPVNWMGAPLMDTQGKPFGAIAIYWETDEQRRTLGAMAEYWEVEAQDFYEKNCELLVGIAAQVSMAIERKQAETKIVDSEARYRAVMEQAPEAVIICDPETGRIVETNTRFTEEFGYKLPRDNPLSVYDLGAASHEQIEAVLEQAKLNGFLPVEQRTLFHKNGTRVVVERSAQLVHYRQRKLLVQTLRNVSDAVRREQEIARDAQMATRLQNALLSVPEASEYLEIATVYRPFGYVGGDLYFLDWRYSGNLLRGFLVDATGHGLCTALHTASLHVLLREVNERDLPLADAMRWLNRRASEYFDEGTFAGALGFEIDLQIRQMRWSCAGIPKVWVSTKTGQGMVEWPGMSLGILAEETFETHTMSIGVGDSLYFMTDGLANLLGSRTEQPLEQYPEMVNLLRKLSESKDCKDDATAVCVRVQALPQSLVRQDGWPRILRFNGYGDYQRLKGEVAKILAEVTGKPHSIQEVAVHEALANAMECRDGVPRQHKARLRFNKVGNCIIVRVKTSRLGFAGNAILKRLRSHPEDMFSFGEDASMGRGIPMMLSMSYKMTYNSEGTEVLLAWKL